MEQKNSYPEFSGLQGFLPLGSFELVMPLIIQYKVHLTISRKRESKLGDYRNAWGGNNHRISVNGNLNKFAFLITLLHELAHLLAFEAYGNKISPHGREWKNIYSQVLKDFIGANIFPEDIALELKSSLQNPGASTCSEVGLQRILNRYDTRKVNMFLVEELFEGQHFVMSNGRVFKRGKQLRKRIKCYELPLMKPYLFSPIFEVKLIEI